MCTRLPLCYFALYNHKIPLLLWSLPVFLAEKSLVLAGKTLWSRWFLQTIFPASVFQRWPPSGPAGPDSTDPARWRSQTSPRTPVRDEGSRAPAATLGGWFFISKYNVVRCDSKHTTQGNKSLLLPTAVFLAPAAWKARKRRDPFQLNHIFKAK